MDFLTFFFTAFLTKVPVIAIMIVALIGISLLAWFFSFKNKKLNSFSQYAPTILTTAGLLGTFVGLTMGLKELRFTNNHLDITSFSALMENLKGVFVYALSGITASLFFMLLNTWVGRLQQQQQLVKSEQLKVEAKLKNQELLTIQRQQEHELASLNGLQDQQLKNQEKSIQIGMQLGRLQQQQLESQKQMQSDIAKLQFDNDNQQLALLISQGVVQGLSPLLMEIKTAVADQGTEAIKKVLEDLKTEILVPMSHTLGHTNQALESTNQAVKDTIKAIQESQVHNEKLITAVSHASEKMETASGKMNGLVDKIESTVQHMDEIQKEQNKTLTTFNSELKQNLDHIPTAIQTGMQAAQDGLVTAINETSSAMQRDVKQVLVDTTTELKDTIGEATTGMKDASQEMQKLVNSIEGTVQHMDDIQVAQKTALDHFNHELQQNLATIQPAIVEGLEHAKGALTAAIDSAAMLMTTSISNASRDMQDNIKVASDKMVANISNTLNEAGTQLKGAVKQATTELSESVTKTIEKQNESIHESFKQFDAAQNKFDEILSTFSKDMNGHLDRMATELEEVGKTSASLINTASENLEKTLGDIDNKLLNTASVLETSLEAFRKQYQESLTEYLEQQTKNLDGFLDRQNEQLEKTIGQQRQGLEDATNSLTEQFKFMDVKQREVNQDLERLIQRGQAAQESILPKVQSIASELTRGEQNLSRDLARSSEHLESVSEALQGLGKDLPPAFEAAFKQLDQNYKESFEDLDHGLKDAVNRLGSTVAALAAAIPLHDAMTQ